jgi:hypothetical protein
MKKGVLGKTIFKWGNNKIVKLFDFDVIRVFDFVVTTYNPFSSSRQIYLSGD